MEKIKVEEINLCKMEGKCYPKSEEEREQIREKGFDPDCSMFASTTSWMEAEIILTRWSMTVGNGYDKTLCEIKWEDGKKYKTRIDLEHPSNSRISANIRWHVKTNLEMLIGTYIPGHLSEKERENFLALTTQAEKLEIREFLKTHDI